MSTPIPQWIWYGDFGLDLVNSYMQARRIFSLAAAPKKAIINVTADSRYRLWVNGMHVCRGPARGYQYSWPYDTVDIALYLRKGQNVMAAIVHNFGISTFQYVHEDFAGFLLWGSAGKIDFTTNDSWRVRPATAYLRHMTRASVQLGFPEFFDARVDDESWMQPGYDDSAWKKPWCRHKGSMPWSGFEERGIPLLRQELIAPVSIVSSAKGTCAEGWHSSTNLIDLYTKEKLFWEAAPAGLDCQDACAKIDFPATGPGKYRAVCIDFGKEVVGSVRLAVDGANGGEIVDYLICEGLSGAQPVIDPPAWHSNGFRSFGNRLILRRGQTSHEQFDHWGFRYLILILRNSTRPLSIRAGLRWTAYPLDVKASFQSSDERLNEIWRMSAHTQQCCMIDAYMDCPWREQAQWWGDARVQMANTFFLSADARLAGRGIRSIGGQEVPGGLTYGHAPTMAHQCILPDFTLTWVMSHGDYWRQTGDLSLYTELRGRIRRALDYFHREISPNGLLPCDRRFWLFLDWSPVFRDGYSTLYNLLYLGALREAAALSRRAGDSENGRIYAQREKALTKAITGRLVDRRRQALFGGLSWKGKPVPETAPHSYAWAILLDLVPVMNERFAAERLLPIVNSHWSKQVTPSSFFMYYVFEALKKTGHGAAVVDCVRRWWGEFIDKGYSTVAEGFDARPAHQSLCHAWSAHPVVHLSNVVLGVWQEATGWRKVHIKPDFSLIDHVDGAVATPMGPVSVSWKKAGNEVDFALQLPPGTIANVELPGLRKNGVTGKFTARVTVGA